MTPLADVVKSPVAVAVLAQAGVESAEQAAGMTDDALLAIKNVGRGAVAHIRAWQAAQEPPIPVPAPLVIDLEDRGWIPQRFPWQSPELDRRRKIDEMAADLYQAFILDDDQRNMPHDFEDRRRLAFEAAEAFYRAPLLPASEGVGVQDGVE